MIRQYGYYLDKDAADEFVCICKQSKAAGKTAGKIYRAFKEFADKGIPSYTVACPLTNNIRVCYWPSTDIKGFFSYNDKVLYVSHIAETSNDYELTMALETASKRFFEYVNDD